MNIIFCDNCEKLLSYSDLQVTKYYVMTRGVDKGNVFAFFTVNGTHTLANLSCNMLPIPTPEKYLKAMYTEVHLTVKVKAKSCKS